MMENSNKSGISFEPQPIDEATFGQTHGLSGYTVPQGMHFRKGPWDKENIARTRTALCFEVARNFSDAAPEESASLYARLPDNALEQVQIKTDDLVQKRRISVAVGTIAFAVGTVAFGLGGLTDVFSTTAQAAVPLGAGILGAAWEGRHVVSINAAIGRIEKDVMDYVRAKPKIMSVYPDYICNTPDAITKTLVLSRR